MTPLIVGLVGGSIGSEPFAPRTWSGISRSVFTELNSRGRLKVALGVKLDAASDFAIKLSNFRTDRALWKRRYYADPRYRRALTRAARRRSATIARDAWTLQFGAMFNGRLATPHAARWFSYNDGNAVMAAAAPFGPRLPPTLFDRTCRYEADVARSMSLVFTTSEYLRRSFITDLNVPAERVVRVGAGVNLSTLPEKVPAGKNYASSELLFIGVEFERKGGAVLLEAFAGVKAKHPDAMLHLVGPPPRQTDIPGVRWHGFVNRGTMEGAALMDDLFRRCSMFVMPSLYEPHGLAPLEALAHGLSCVVTDDWALRENIKGGVNGALVPAGDAFALERTISQLLYVPDRLRDMGSGGPEAVRGEHTWPVVIGRMLEAMAHSQRT